MADSMTLSSVLPPPMQLDPTAAAFPEKDTAGQSSNPLSALPAPTQAGPIKAALAAQHVVTPQGDEIVHSKNTAKTRESHDIRDAATKHNLTSGDKQDASTGHAQATAAAGLAIPLARSAALAGGAAEFSPAAGFDIVAGAALLVGTQSAPPVSREQATAIGTAENAKYAGKTSDHVPSPYSNLKADQALPTQAQLDSRANARQLSPQPQAGAAPTSLVAHPSGSSTTTSPVGEPRGIEHTGHTTTSSAARLTPEILHRS